jgi:O-methyltransferase
MSLYLNLMKGVLTRSIWIDDPKLKETRRCGLDWPIQPGELTGTAETMVGTERLDNLMELCQEVLRLQVPGDFMECGVWRGGCAIMMKAILKYHGNGYRNVWVADSFQGCPDPNPSQYPKDENDKHSTFKFLAVSQAEVEANFDRYGLLDGGVKFLPGWFKDTLPGPVKKLAILRLDGDLYESTMQALEALYSKVSPGGYVIIDDYGAVPGCKAAVRDFFLKYKINAHVRHVGYSAVYWRVTEQSEQYDRRFRSDKESQTITASEVGNLNDILNLE